MRYDTSQLLVPRNSQRSFPTAGGFDLIASQYMLCYLSIVAQLSNHNGVTAGFSAGPIASHADALHLAVLVRPRPRIL